MKATRTSATSRASRCILGRQNNQKSPSKSQEQNAMLEKTGVIQRYNCSRVDCEDEYIGESDRKFTESFKDDMNKTYLYCYT